jgi:hypothetical protein
MTRLAGIGLLAMLLGACRTTAVGQAPASIAVSPLFGPVIGAEVIAGRVDDDQVLLLAGGVDLVRVDLRARTFARTHLGIAPGESCWALARAGKAIWTLKGRHTLARIDRGGQVVEQIPLAAPHFGLFAAGNRLVYQEAAFTPPGPALLVGSPDGTRRKPWSAITTRTFDRLARASAAALNMVSCGTTETEERPCWFPDEAAIFLVAADGATRRVTLPGLAVVPPETLLTAENPARPVRDAYVEPNGDIWILSSGAPAAGIDAPGGWIVARYGSRGEPRGLSHLSEPARLILAVDTRRVTLLLSSGQVAEVEAW